MAAPASSSALPLGDLPRIDCPKCKLQVIKCLTQKNEVYYKCPNHFKNDSTCKYYWYEGPYLEYLRANHPALLQQLHPEVEEKPLVQTNPPDVNADLALQFSQMQLQLSEVKAQMGDVMVKIMEAKDEIKKEVAKGQPSPPPTCIIA